MMLKDFPKVLFTYNSFKILEYNVPCKVYWIVSEKPLERTGSTQEDLVILEFQHIFQYYLVFIRL